MFSLSGKVALVTGASGGLGQAIAQKLKASGAHLMLTGTRKEVLEKLATELGEGVSYHAANLQDSEQIEELIAKTIQVFGRLDILVNNAGLTRDGLILRMKDEDWDQVMNVNAKAMFLLCRATAKIMMKQRFGRIVNISSIVGFTGNAGQVNYAASKAAMIGFTKSLAQELASRNICVNAIAPGFIQTAMTDVLEDKVQEALLSKIPCGRLGHPDDIAAGVVYLSSDEAGYVTGQTLHINGGMAMV